MLDLVRVLVLISIAACSSPHKHERDANELMAKIRGTAVFGARTEYVPSPSLGWAGMFDVRPQNECEIAILPGGEDSFAARMDLLARAKKTILVQALIYTGDESGLRVAEVLKQKKREGLDVRVIVDPVNNLGLQTQWMYYDLQKHGVEVLGYTPLFMQLWDEIPLPLFVRDDRDPNQRYHEKLWIIDPGTPNAEAVTGGLNIANEYFRVDPSNVPRYWRDQDVLVRGAIVRDLTQSFEVNWAHFQERTRNNDSVWHRAREVLGESHIAFTRRADLDKTVATLEARPVPRDYRPARCRWFQSRPRLAETFIQQAYLKLLDQAKTEVLIANAYFVPTPSLRMAIKEAAARCVRVVLLSNGAETSDTPGMNVLSRAYYKDLMSANGKCKTGGVEIWEWLGRKPSETKQTQGLLHAKYAVVDRRLSLVGSYNLDPRSERLNSESAIVYENTELAEQLAKLFLESDLSTSRQISAKEAATFEKPESVRQRMKKDFARLFEDLL